MPATPKTKFGQRKTETPKAQVARSIPRAEALEVPTILTVDDAALARVEAIAASMRTKYKAQDVITFIGRNEILGDVAPSSGLAGADYVIGCGGFPEGRIIEIFGPESSGKTTLGLHAIAAAQRRGGVAAFVDAEHALQPTYAASLGVNLSTMLFAQPMAGEQALDVVEDLCRQGVNVIVVDSVAAITPTAELEGDMGDAHVGLQARLMSQAMRKLVGVVQRNRVTLIFINQIRLKVGVMFGNPETTPGGNALRFFASLRLDVRKSKVEGTGTDAKNPPEFKTRVKAVKNKVGPPFRETELYFATDGRLGYDPERSLLDAADAAGLLTKDGSWFSFEGERLANGRPNTTAMLRHNPEIAARIEQRFREHMGWVS